MTASSRNEPLVGSFAARDCLFLVQPLQPLYRAVHDKERLIQLGRMHYSEVITEEHPPSPAYVRMFERLTATYKRRMAGEVLRLAEAIAARRSGAITLVSLLRAGTPPGVLLRRALENRLHREASHYSVSIIRDRGIDHAALDYLLERGHEPSSFVFVDGWTAKGTITHELHSAVAHYNATRGVQLPSELFVLSDIGGTADVAASSDDYPMPCAVMNATVSGLVSRSILNDQVGEGEFHGCVSYGHLHEHDRSRWFVDQVSAEFEYAALAPGPALAPEGATALSQAERHSRAQGCLRALMHRYQISDRNRIKPGIAEATRVMLRRVPDLLVLRDPGHADVAHLRQLAQEKRVRVAHDSTMPFGACALIRDVLNAACRQPEAKAAGAKTAGA